MMASKQEHWSLPLFGPKILTKAKTTGVPTASALAGKKIVALYFSASWCPPCKSFTPLLIDFYNNANKNDLEIIFLSSDRDEESFNGYFAKMPWLSSIPGYSGADANNRQRQLADKFKIQGIPSLIILDGQGNYITDNGRTLVMQATSDESKKALVESWKSAEAVPIDQAVFSSGSERGWFGSLVIFIAKNPIYLIGMMYFAKQVLKYLESLGEGEDNGAKEL